MRRKVIFNGRLCDGSGAEIIPQDILLENEKISAIAQPGAFKDADAEFIDAENHIVAPGFIDAHSHGEVRKLQYPENRTKFLQGITTEVDGNCGYSSACVPYDSADFKWNDLSEYAQTVNERKISTNTVVLAGHNSLRNAVMGSAPRTADATEIQAMQQLLTTALEQGAAGWSTGLTYFPGKFSNQTELSSLAECTRNSKKVYATHMRSEGDDLMNALDEAIAAAAAGSGILQISHIKTIFPRNYHKLDAMLEKIEAARQAGLTVYADRYPYIYSSTAIRQTLPEPYCKVVDIADKLRESTAYQAEVTAALAHSPRDLATTIVTAKNMTLQQIAEVKNCSIPEACMLEIMENPGANAAYLCMSESNLQRILSLPWVCAGSDGISMQLDDPAQAGHPRAAGALPRFFNMTQKLCGTAEAVRKMTGLPAGIFRIPRRGLIKPGFIADLVIFDENTLDSPADFGNCAAAPQGIKRIMLAGETAWDEREPDRIQRLGKFIAVD